MIRAVAGASYGAVYSYASPFAQGAPPTAAQAQAALTATAGGGRSAASFAAASSSWAAPSAGTSGGIGALLATLGSAIGGFFQWLADLFRGGAQPAQPGNPASPPAGGPAAQPAVPAQPGKPAAPAVGVPPGVPDWNGPHGFGPQSFMLEPTGSGPNGSYRYNSLQFATKEAAEKAASLLGGTVISIQYDQGPFRLSQPYYHIQVGKATLNAGLVINTFLRNPPEVAMRMLQAEIRQENGQP